MKLRAQRVLPAACCAMLSIPLLSAQPTLTGEQQRAAGIAVAHPLAAKAPERIEALGLVLDATTLISDLGETTAAITIVQYSNIRALRAAGADPKVSHLLRVTARADCVSIAAGIVIDEFERHQLDRPVDADYTH